MAPFASYDWRTAVNDFRIPPGYTVNRVDAWVGPACDMGHARFEALEGKRKIGDFGFKSDAIEACRKDTKKKGWAKGRYDLIREAADEEDAPPPPVDGCSKCGRKVEDDGAMVLWRCQVCDKIVCRRCTLTVPGIDQYFDTTLCSHACWVEAGRPDE